MAKAPQTPKSVRLSLEELIEADEAIRKAGSFKAVVMAGIRQTNGKAGISKAQVLEWIKYHAK